ncbi:MAG: lipoyl(octanoyl) transferase LipB [Methylococcaceae bacterium]|nr:lipoyl(octanoyl) transferase LipB [Methylococcaceae bacterium]
MAEPGLSLFLSRLGTAEYRAVWQAMREFTENRDEATADEIWLVEHPPVYTLGRNGDRAHILAPGVIPIVESDRGGQVTYHGPGQLVAYTLFDLNRLGIGVRSLVQGLERAVIGTLAQYGVRSEARADAPGVYVDGRKIASLGLRIRHGRSYHGISLNVDLDLAPFRAINPCGHAGLEVTRLADLGAPVKPFEVALPLLGEIVREFGYRSVESAG